MSEQNGLRERLDEYIHKLIKGCEATCAKTISDEDEAMYWRADGAGDVLEQILIDLPEIAALAAHPPDPAGHTSGLQQVDGDRTDTLREAYNVGLQALRAVDCDLTCDTETRKQVKNAISEMEASVVVGEVENGTKV